MESLRVRQILLEVLSDEPDGPADVWIRLCAAATLAVPVSGAGVALMTDAGHSGTLGSTAGVAAVIEDLQQVLGEGPCLEASRERRPVLEGDLAGSGPARWPIFGPAATDAGAAAIFAFPLQIGAIRLGVMDLYRDTPGPLDSRQLGEALAFADAAATILLELQHDSSADSLHPKLAEVADNHREVHQASGMIAVQAGVGLAEALLLLRAHAYSHDRPLREVAHDVVARIVTFAPEDDHRE